MKTWFRRHHLVRMATALLLSTHTLSAAQLIVHDAEPNNTPETLQAVAGSVRIMGTLPSSDQDGFLWTVEETNSLQPWTFSLQGIPGALTAIDVLRLQYAKDGQTLTGTQKLFTLQSRDGSRPATLAGLLFEPGEYVLGFARAGGDSSGSRPPMGSGAFAAVNQAFGAQETDDQPLPANGYRLDIVAESESRLSQPVAADTPRQKAPEIRRNNTTAMVAPAAQSWYRFTLDETASQQRWDLLFRTTVGQTLAANLQDKEGKPLASARTDAQGQAKLPDLSLPPGEYFLLLEGEAEAIHVITLTAAGLKVEGEEAEPNNEWKMANRVDLFQGVNGRLQVDRDVDIYRFELTQEQADQRLKLTLQTEAEGRYGICLLDNLDRKIQCREPEGRWAQGGLRLEAGQYGVKLERGQTGMAYHLGLQSDGKPDAGVEAEPNDEINWATTVLLGKRVRGSFDVANDTDFYRVDVDSSPQMWRFQVNGDKLRELTYYDGRGRRLQRTNSGAKRLTLDRLYLAPGTHYISIRGSDKADYVLLSRAQGLPDPNQESEPNDSAQGMLPLHMGKTRTGGFHDPGDKDMYYFQLANHDHIRLNLKAPQDADVKMRVNLDWEGKKLKELELSSRQEDKLEGVYPPGSYVLTLSTNQATDDHYIVDLQRLARYTCSIDCEPNDNPAFSSPLPADGHIRGRSDPALRGDTDWYTLPVRDQDTEWHFATTSQAQLVLQLEQDENKQRLKRESPDQPYRVNIPAHQQGYLLVTPKEDYEIQVLPDGQAQAFEPPIDLSELSLSVQLPVSQLAAYAQTGQQVEGTIDLRNAGQQALTLKLDAVASDLGWQVIPQESTVEIPAGASQEIPVHIHVPEDVRAVPVQICVRAAHASGAYAHADILLEALADAPVVGSHPYWVVPAPLRGGLNLAAASLGAEVLKEEQASAHRNPESLIDGAAGSSRDFEWRQQKLPYVASVTVQLAGDGTQPIAGFALNPLSHLPMHRAPQHFSVALSDDGTQFDTVLQDTLQPVRQEQYFALPSSRSARFARLTIHQNYNGDWGGNTALGEWQVIARPGSALTGNTAFNLAAQHNGGHVVHAHPTYERNDHWIDPESKPFWGGQTIDIAGNQQAYWVLGFHNNRAALIDHIVWRKARGDKEHPIEDVDVQVSVHGPVGPWTSIGRFQPKLDEDAKWQLPEPVWARFVRFELPLSDQRRRYAAPAAVQVYETQTNEQYQSILGAWGGNAKAIYEDLHPADAPPTIDPNLPHAKRETPQTLLAGQAARGNVQLGDQEHWYLLRMPDESNQLDLHLSDPFYLKAALSVETSTGEPVPLTPEQTEGNQRRWTVSAPPGSELLVKVFEPPRNVIFAWDTSGSVSTYHEQTYNAIGEYARGLKPGRDMANLLPFGGKLQLQDWHSDPYLMLQAINEHKGTDSSSAEHTLVTASDALAQRSGSRAVVLITDAETPIDGKLWPALTKGQPQVIALGLGSAAGGMSRNPNHEKNLMLNWSRVNGGHYSMAHDINDMAHAFERTSVLLRQPTPYELQVEAKFVEPPADGALRVVAAQVPKGSKQAARSGPVTAFILDASGSMLQRLDGERRIEIAKRGLMQAVSEQIPPGTPVSLRVFGHKEADSCRSDLELPLQPLDVAAARKVIGRIQAKNLARTPIADSLSLVRQDLAQATGPRTIVLVTDGEETCDGNPEAVIRELISEGFDVRLNIIGFALDDPILEQIFGGWAKLGGGEYFSAADKQSFEQAVGKALQTSYTVINAAGKDIAQGQVDGEPIALPPGSYRIKVGLVPELVLDDVNIHTEDTTTVELK